MPVCCSCSASGLPTQIADFLAAPNCHPEPGPDDLGGFCCSLPSCWERPTTLGLTSQQHIGPVWLDRPSRALAARPDCFGPRGGRHPLAVALRPPRANRPIPLAARRPRTPARPSPNPPRTAHQQPSDRHTQTIRTPRNLLKTRHCIPLRSTQLQLLLNFTTIDSKRISACENRQTMTGCSSIQPPELRYDGGGYLIQTNPKLGSKT